MKVRIGNHMVNIERMAEFVSAVGIGVMVICGFLFFFGKCYGGFLR